MTSTEHTPLPWDAVEANEHHGPYITTAFGTTVCDLYAMSDPMSGERKPITFTDGDVNLHLIVKCVNAHNDLVAALKGLSATYDGIWVTMSDSEMAACKEAWEQAEAALAKAGAL